MPFAYSCFISKELGDVQGLAARNVVLLQVLGRWQENKKPQINSVGETSLLWWWVNLSILWWKTWRGWPWTLGWRVRNRKGRLKQEQHLQLNDALIPQILLWGGGKADNNEPHVKFSTPCLTRLLRPSFLLSGEPRNERRGAFCLPSRQLSIILGWSREE